MRSCQDRKETLWLDIYGELSPSERSAWEKHLEACEGCREERKRMRSMLQQVKEVMPPPTLSQKEAAALAEAIKRRLVERQKRRWWQEKLWDRPSRLIPAGVAVSLLIVALGWYGIKEFKTPFSGHDVANLSVEEQMIAKDLEVIKNLELLEEMDALQKLVKLVSERDLI